MFEAARIAVIAGSTFVSSTCAVVEAALLTHIINE
jgi:hypothetical protein